eukprot:754178-Hanusia_phi.AAC.4
MENERDSTFADMYLHPQEVDYTVPSLMQWIDTVKDLDVKFAGFSNPKLWKLERLLAGAPEALARAQKLPQEQQYRLIELLDPDTFTCVAPIIAVPLTSPHSHYEFFLVKGEVQKKNWHEASEEEIYSAKAIRQAGIQPWPADRVFDQVRRRQDVNPLGSLLLQDYNLVQFTDAEYAFLQLCAQDPTVETVSVGPGGRRGGHGSSTRRSRSPRQSRTSLPRWSLPSQRRRFCACLILSSFSSSLASDCTHVTEVPSSLAELRSRWTLIGPRYAVCPNPIPGPRAASAARPGNPVTVTVGIAGRRARLLRVPAASH